MACNIKDQVLHEASNVVDGFCAEVMSSININVDAFNRIGAFSEINAIVTLLDAAHKKATEAHNASIVGRH